VCQRNGTLDSSELWHGHALQISIEIGNFKFGHSVNPFLENWKSYLNYLFLIALNEIKFFDYERNTAINLIFLSFNFPIK
jgi:hypothetical protein